VSEYIVKVLETNFITHDVKRFVVEKPDGYTFIPGQATDVAINVAEWKNELRPFTFTCLPQENYLEFMIKIYTKKNGVTHALGGINAGGELILHDVFGAIQYKGAGVFLAGGAGVTPFIAILRQLYSDKLIHGNKLIFSNKTSEDIILFDELTEMLGDNFVNVLTREDNIGFLERRIDRNFLIDNISDFTQNFYICGPDEFVKSITENLKQLGAKSDSLVFEQ
jgi:ferredoxin-NADP reductase